MRQLRKKYNHRENKSQHFEDLERLSNENKEIHISSDSGVERRKLSDSCSK